MIKSNQTESGVYLTILSNGTFTPDKIEIQTNSGLIELDELPEFSSKTSTTIKLSLTDDATCNIYKDNKSAIIPLEYKKYWSVKLIDNLDYYFKSIRGSLRTGVADVGDIVLYDNYEDKLIVIDITNPQQEFHIVRYSPIAIIVIPSQHDVYGDGSAAAMSLTESAYVSWGPLWEDIPGLDRFTRVNILDRSQEEIVGLDTTAYIPSDNFDQYGIQCLHDVNSYYFGDYIGFAPSVYLSDGSRNWMYYDTTMLPDSYLNCLSDFNGEENTRKILDKRGYRNYKYWSPDYKTYADYPAVSFCNMFSKDGLSQGKWYLPAIGELGYMISRMKLLNNRLQIVIDTLGDEYATILGKYNNYWSSTLSDGNSVRIAGLADGSANETIRTSTTSYVRPYVKIPKNNF